MKKLIGISGSLRRASFNTALLRAAAGLLPAGWELELRTIRGIPLYDGDVEEAEGVPKTVTELKDSIAAAQGVVIATPEYNNSVPGVLKNAIDWLTRPPADIKRVFAGKPVAIAGATIGGFGTVLAQSAWLPVLRTLGTRPWFEGKLQVSKANEAFGPSGELKDEKLREQVRTFLVGFTAFAEAASSSRR